MNEEFQADQVPDPVAELEEYNDYETNEPTEFAFWNYYSKKQLACSFLLLGMNIGAAIVGIKDLIWAH